MRESWPFRYTKKKGDFFRLIWAEIFLHKSLTDSGISHRFCVYFLFTQLLADSNIYTSVEYFYTGVEEGSPATSPPARGGLLGQGSVDGVVGSGTIGGVGVTTGSGRTDEKTSTSTRR